MLIILPSKRDHTKCMLSFITDLNKICSPQEKIIVEFIKMTPFQKLHTLNLNTVLLPDDPQLFLFCLLIVVHESLVCPEQLNFLLFFRKNPSAPTNSLVFQLFCVLEPLLWNDCMILRFKCSNRGQLRDSFAFIIEDSNAHWCSQSQLGSSTIAPSNTARNLGVAIDDKLNFSDHITKLSADKPVDLLYTTLERSGPFSQSMQHNSLFRLLFCPDLTIAMLSWQVFQPVPSNLYN